MFSCSAEVNSSIDILEAEVKQEQQRGEGPLTSDRLIRKEI